MTQGLQGRPDEQGRPDQQGRPGLTGRSEQPGQQGRPGLTGRSEQQRAIGTLLRRLQVHGDHIVSVFASTHGVHHTDLSALIHIMDAEAQGAPLTASELQDRLNLTSGATTAVIDRLERLNHATRSRDSADRRKVHLHHSEEAREVGQEFFAPLGMLTAEVLDAFTPEEVDVVIRFLELLTDAYEQHGTTLAKSP
ncbi:MAG TPA: MarR family transcriptional regulator [Dermatophilaceae bacterium]|nr:MarR family transcriptional regulator [Dermatophilaceae bacterium]